MLKLLENGNSVYRNVAEAKNFIIKNYILTLIFCNLDEHIAQIEERWLSMREVSGSLTNISTNVIGTG